MTRLRRIHYPIAAFLLGFVWYGLMFVLPEGRELMADLASRSMILPMLSFPITSAILGVAFRGVIRRSGRVTGSLLGIGLTLLGAFLYGWILGVLNLLVTGPDEPGQTLGDMIPLISLFSCWTTFTALAYGYGTLPMGVFSTLYLRWFDRTRMAAVEPRPSAG